MTIVDWEVVLAVVNDVVLPEALRAVKAHRNAKGKDPTLDELKTRLAFTLDQIQASGQRLVDETRQSGKG